MGATGVGVHCEQRVGLLDSQNVGWQQCWCCCLPAWLSHCYLQYSNKKWMTSSMSMVSVKLGLGSPGLAGRGARVGSRRFSGWVAASPPGRITAHTNPGTSSSSSSEIETASEILNFRFEATWEIIMVIRYFWISLYFKLVLHLWWNCASFLRISQPLSQSRH